MLNIGSAIVLRGSGTSNTLVFRCESNVIGNLTGAIGNIQLFNGPHHNSISRTRIKSALCAVAFQDCDRAPEYIAAYPHLVDLAALNVADTNVFDDCIFECKEAAIDLCWYSDRWDSSKSWFQYKVINNKFINCTFIYIGGGNYTTGELFRSNRLCENNEITNCIFKGFQTYSLNFWGVHGASPQAPHIPPNEPSQFAFRKDCLHPNLATFPSQMTGNGNILADPKVKTISYGLESDSPCINAGEYSHLSVIDFDGDPRSTTFPYNYDIGAQEYFPPGGSP
jgi:hypothetical protein